MLTSPVDHLYLRLESRKEATMYYNELCDGPAGPVSKDRGFLCCACGLQANCTLPE